MHIRNRRVHKWMSAALSVLLAVGMALPAAAINDTSGSAAVGADITIQGGGANEYVAWRLMNLNTSLKNATCHPNGDHIVDGDASCFNYSYSINPDYEEVVLANAIGADLDGSGDVEETELLEWMTGLDAQSTRDFANSVMVAIKETTADAVAEEQADGTFLFRDVRQGYYLIASTSASTVNGAHTLAMLDTAGHQDLTVTPKDGMPTIIKKILVPVDGTGNTFPWQDENFDFDPNLQFLRVDATDVGWGDEVLYELSITWPENIQDFDLYNFTVHNVDRNMEITNVLGALIGYGSPFETAGDGFVEDTSEAMRNLQESLTDSTLVQLPTPATKLDHVHGWEKENTVHCTDGCSFHYSACIDNFFESENISTDLTRLGAPLTTTVLYTAKLKDGYTTASTGNQGDVYLEYVADPYDNSNTSNTPKDNTVVYTFDVCIDKVNPAFEPLPGANFALYKLDSNKALQWLKDNNLSDSNSTVSILDIPEDMWELYRTAGEHTPDATSIGTANAGSDFTFPAVSSSLSHRNLVKSKAADDAAGLATTYLYTSVYKVVETVVPDGYYKADDVYFVLDTQYMLVDDTGNGLVGVEGLEFPAHDASHLEQVLQFPFQFKNGNGEVFPNADAGSWGDNSQDLFTVDLAAGNGTATVVNNSGNRLPSTGGTGTYVFYGLGAAIVIGTVIVLMMGNMKKKEDAQ